jgi:hypothetical protein
MSCTGIGPEAVSVEEPNTIEGIQVFIDKLKKLYNDIDDSVIGPELKLAIRQELSKWTSKQDKLKKLEAADYLYAYLYGDK